MKKLSNAIVKDYEKLRDDQVEYYGVFTKDGRVKVDTKRYRKFMNLPDTKIEHRQTVYYQPSRIHRSDYYCNRFRDTLQELKNLWLNEFSLAIKAIKTPKQVEDDVRIGYLQNGVYEYDEASTIGVFEGMKRIEKYKFVIKSIYAQFFHQMMSQIDALCLRICVANGYREKDFSKEKFDVYIQGLQKQNAIDFPNFNNYAIYDKAYRVWNFLKHNSLKAYNQLKKYYPEMVYDPNNNYRNGDPAISVLKINEKYIIYCLDNLHLFFDEVCERGFKENIKDADWDYDDYFLNEANDFLDNIINPLGLPDYL